jgi:hypothetical protein
MHTPTHTKAFLIFVGVLVLIVVVHSYLRYYAARDYQLHVFSVCDPSLHSCFVDDPSKADPTFQTGPYDKILIDAAHAPSCLDEHTCQNFSCDSVGGSCSVQYCSLDALEAGESCSGHTP